MTISAFPTPWFSKFADLPVFPARSVMPAMDGDIAWLHHLRSTLAAHQERHALAPLPADYLYYSVLIDTAIVPGAMDWPDPAGAQLAAWRSGR